MPPIPETETFQSSERPLLAFLPLVYVAWADGDLEPAELEEISERIERAGLEEGCRVRLQRWLDPEVPPTARELAAILRTVRRIGPELPAEARGSLARFGSEMARVALEPGDEAGDAEPLSQAVEEALAALEEALGVVGHEASRGLLVEDRPEPEAEPTPEPKPAFDIDKLRALIDQPHAEVREKVREIVAAPQWAYPYELPKEEYREWVLERCRELADAGLGGLGFPARHGGAGDTGKFMAAFETLAFSDQSVLVKFGVQFGLFAGSVYQLGTERHHEAWLRAAATLGLPGCFAMSETGHGSNVADIETTATYLPEREEFEIHTPRPAARKDWIGNAAAHARVATVFAQLVVGDERHGVHAFVVPIRTAEGQPAAGVAIEDCGLKEGLNGVDNGRLSFDRVRVPRDHLLDRFARVSPEGEYQSPIASPAKRFFTMLGTLVGGRISVASAALSASKTGLAIAIRYGDRRRQFGPAGAAEVRILDYLSHQRRLLPRLATTYAIDFAIKHLVKRFVHRTGDDDREIETLAAGIKAYASRHNIDTLQEAREACGGKGYLAENRIPALRNDTDVYTTFEGDNTVLLQLVAKGRLTEFRHQFSDPRWTTLLRYITARAATALAELNPIVTRTTDEEHLVDPAFHHAAFRYREERLLRSVALRLKRRIDGGMDSFTAFNQCQDHLISMALAHVERVLVDRFTAAVEGVEDNGVKAALETLRRLFALSRLESDRGWFLEVGYFEGVKARAIRAAVNQLCGETREVALELVEGWGIPDECVAAPIAVGEPA